MIEPLQLLLLLLLVFLFGCHCCVALQCCVSPMSIAIIANCYRYHNIFIYICYRYCYRCCCHCQLLFAIVVVQCLSLYRCLLLIQVPTFFFSQTNTNHKKKTKKIIKTNRNTNKKWKQNKTKNEPKTKPNSLNSTSAMSLLYECINTVIAVLISISSGMPNHSASIQLCVQKLRILIEDSDQNCEYK